MQPVSQLSKREKEVVNLLLQGKSNKLIALTLGISDRTVEFHLKNVYAKLHVSSRIELILKLGNTPGDAAAEKPGSSTVAKPEESAETGGKLNRRMKWAAFFKKTVSIIGHGVAAKKVLDIRPVRVEWATVLVTSLLWGAILLFLVGASVK